MLIGYYTKSYKLIYYFLAKERKREKKQEVTVNLNATRLQPWKRNENIKRCSKKSSNSISHDMQKILYWILILCCEVSYYKMHLLSKSPQVQKRPKPGNPLIKKKN